MYAASAKMAEQQACALKDARDCGNCNVSGYAMRSFFPVDSTKGGAWDLGIDERVQCPPPRAAFMAPAHTSHCGPPHASQTNARLFDTQTRVKGCGPPSPGL